MVIGPYGLRRYISEEFILLARFILNIFNLILSIFLMVPDLSLYFFWSYFDCRVVDLLLKWSLFYHTFISLMWCAHLFHLPMSYLVITSFQELFVPHQNEPSSSPFYAGYPQRSSIWAYHVQEQWTNIQMNCFSCRYLRPKGTVSITFQVLGSIIWRWFQVSKFLLSTRYSFQCLPSSHSPSFPQLSALRK